MMQLPLSVSLRDGASFSNYHAGPNVEAVHALHELLKGGEKYIYLWGAAGTGKTHLLQAACQVVAARGETAAYLPLMQAREISTELLAGLEQVALVCVDDVQAIANNSEWETALFHLYNRLRETDTRLIVAAGMPPANLVLGLSDLSSRLASGLILQLRELSDEEKLVALRLRAHARGFELTEEVARFLLRHCPRDMPRLFELLQRLDHASLANQRKVTIPFVRDLIKGHL